MDSIQLTNLMAIVHLCFVCCLIGCFMTEAVIEYYSLFFDKTFHNFTIRFHKWIDLFVELPFAVGVLVTGTILIFTIERITVLHIIKIFFSLSGCICIYLCIKNVLHRDKMLEENFSKEALFRQSKKLMLKITGFLMFFFYASLGLGIFLGYNRVCDILL